RPSSTLFPYTTLFRSNWARTMQDGNRNTVLQVQLGDDNTTTALQDGNWNRAEQTTDGNDNIAYSNQLNGSFNRTFQDQIGDENRSEEHTSELQSRENL